MRIHRKAIKNSADYYLVNDADEDVGRVEKGRIVYPRDVAANIVSAIKGRDQLEKDLHEAEQSLAQYRAQPTDIKPLDLSKISDDGDTMITTIQLEDYDLQGLLKRGPWLTFGTASIRTETTCDIGAHLSGGVQDFEHSSAYAVRINLVGLRFKFTSGHVSYFEAHLTPKYDDIRIHEPDFDPTKVKGAVMCKECEDKHLLLPDGYYIPPVYKYAKLVAGTRVSITIGPNWGAICAKEG